MCMRANGNALIELGTAWELHIANPTYLRTLALPAKAPAA